MDYKGLFFFAVGLFAICGGVFDWEFFMNHRKARFLTSILGRSGARIFYVILGLGICVIGVLFTLKIIKS